MPTKAIFLTGTDRAKFKVLGGARWLRQQIDLAVAEGRVPARRSKRVRCNVDLQPDQGDALSRLGGSAWVHDRIQKQTTGGTP